MSTRATYQFKGPYGLNVTFYIHSDGYLSGAAHYLFQGIVTPAKGGFAEAFFRGNPEAEITASHEIHGDTDYRYTVMLGEMGRPEHLIVHERHWLNSEKPKLVVKYVGPLDEFVNTHRADWAPRPQVLRIKFGHCEGYRLSTEEKERAEIERQRAYLADYRVKFPQFTGNISGMEGTIERMSAALQEALAPQPAAPQDSPPAPEPAPVKVRRKKL